MSRSFMRRSAAAAAAATTGLLLLGAPSQAAPTTEAAVEPAVSAADVAANNAAVWASLPPNVTMTVIGKLPKLQGPMDYYIQNGPTTTAGATSVAAAATVPFSFTFSGVYDYNGREFTSARTTVCKDVQARWDFPEESYHLFKISLRGSAITLPTDGVARSYCWSGLPTGTIMRFRYYSTNNSGGDIAKASGSGQVRY